MRHDKNLAFELRKQGKTYREIKKILNLSTSTLSQWLGNEEWSRHIKNSNTKKHIKRSVEHLQKMNASRRTILDQKYKNIEQEAREEFEIYKNDPLFMAGLLLYAGEGDKNTRHLVRLSNAEFYLHSVFIKFSEKFLHTGKKNIKFSLLLYPEHSIKDCVNIWSEKLQINKLNFYKSQVIQGKSKLRKLQYGVGNSIILSTSLKKKMLKWLELCSLYFS